MAQYGGGVRDPDSFYVQDCRQVQNNTHAIQTLTGQISRKIGSSGNDKDILQCRSMVDDAVRQATETRTILARIREHQAQAQNAAERNNRRMMYQKLSDNLAITARVLEDVVRRFHAEEARRPRLRAADADAAGGEEQLIPLVDAGAGLGMGLLKTDALDEELQNEKCMALRRVDEDMKSLQRIYTDLATAAEDQQTSFDSLESHMASAAADIERGREQIQLSGKYAWGGQLKRKMVTLGGGVLAVMAISAYLFSG
mmetsp:Transcript_28017/g.80469  ORF Transcript_28017/g.80469 Transcript_28017/m.80469 type:complete len:256 (+) Transcript_28017:54-821(+)